MNAFQRGLKRRMIWGWLLVVILSAVGQIIAQPSATSANSTNKVILKGDNPATNGEFYPDLPRSDAVSNSPDQFSPTFSWLTTQVGTEAEAKPAVIYGSMLELWALKPDSVQSGEYLGVEQNGILVQAARSNPLQLINPFAPAKYGDGEANILRKLSTKEVEGLKLWQISF